MRGSLVWRAGRQWAISQRGRVLSGVVYLDAVERGCSRAMFDHGGVPAWTVVYASDGSGMLQSAFFWLDDFCIKRFLLFFK
jgi:hypothetical protein